MKDTLTADDKIWIDGYLSCCELEKQQKQSHRRKRISKLKRKPGIKQRIQARFFAFPSLLFNKKGVKLNDKLAFDEKLVLPLNRKEREIAKGLSEEVWTYFLKALFLWFKKA